MGLFRGVPFRYSMLVRVVCFGLAAITLFTPISGIPFWTLNILIAAVYLGSAFYLRRRFARSA